MPTRKEDLPRTIQRSDEHAQHTYAKAHDSAVETYGEGRRAHQTAFSALKHSYKKEGDHWVEKDTKGPSDPQAARGPESRPRSTDEPRRSTAGGKEVPMEQWPKDALYEEAKRLDVPGAKQAQQRRPRAGDSEAPLAREDLLTDEPAPR